jgi:hypothetical protein
VLVNSVECHQYDSDADYGLPKLDDQDTEQGYHNREVRE